MLFRPAEDAPRATRTQPGGQIISETRTPNMAQNLPTLSGFGCGDRQLAETSGESAGDGNNKEL